MPLEPFAERFKAERVFGRLEGRKLVPYWTRWEIRQGKLDGQGLELAWAKDPVALFFVEVQGSGTLRAAGRERAAHRLCQLQRTAVPEHRLAAHPGGRHSAKEAMSMQALRSWLAANPAAV